MSRLEELNEVLLEGLKQDLNSNDCTLLILTDIAISLATIADELTKKGEKE